MAEVGTSTTTVDSSSEKSRVSVMGMPVEVAAGVVGLSPLGFSYLNDFEVDVSNTTFKSKR